MMDGLCNNQEGFCGRFASIRSRFDYSYHAKHDKRRQLMQDVIIEKFLGQDRPAKERCAILLQAQWDAEQRL